MENLRNKAKKIIKGKNINYDSYNETQLKKLIHELQIHEVELELQNQELLESRKETEKAKEKYTTLFDFAPLSYLIFDKNGVIKSCNLATIELLKKERKILINKPFIVFLRAKDIDEFFNHIQRCIKSKKREICQLRIHTDIEKNIQLNVFLHSLYLDDRMLISSITDITELESSKSKLINAKEQAEESDKLKSAFLANMSHEIRTPINSVLGYTELLMRKELSRKKTNHYLSVIQQKGNELLNLINDIIDISKISSNQMDINNKPVNIYALFKNIFNDHLYILKNKTKEDNINFIFDTKTKNHNLKIVIDETKIRQIVNNLLNNAIKFTNKGFIKFQYNIEQNNLKINISDSGIGINKEHIENIFKPFRQSDEGISRKYEGTGLGLAIVKSLVDLMNGSIKLNTEINKGTEVKLSIPIDDDINQETINPIDQLNQIDLNQINTYIIEDDPASKMMLEEMLIETKANVYSFSDAEEALDFMVKCKPDLVFMDLALPNISGYDAQEYIKKVYSNAYIIAQTAYSSSKVMENCLRVGFNDFLSKPINITTLIHSINDFLAFYHKLA